MPLLLQQDVQLSSYLLKLNHENSKAEVVASRLRHIPYYLEISGGTDVIYFRFIFKLLFNRLYSSQLQ